MKHTWKIWLLILPALVLLILVMVTDIAFYRVPSIINLFRFEREVVVWLVFLSLLPLVRDIFNRFSWSPQRSLILHAISIIGLELILILPQITLKKYLNLWDDNPLLAEFPFAWVTVSSLIAVLFVAGIMFDLRNIKTLLHYRRRGSSQFVFSLLIGFFLLAAGVFFFTENRTTFQPVSILNEQLQPFLWPIVGLYGGVFLLNVRFKQWLMVLNRRQKIIASIVGLLVVGSGVLICFSHLLRPVYAYSMSIKGFTLAAFTYLVFFSVVAEGALLLSLPGAAIYDQLAQQMALIGGMGRLVQTGSDRQHVADFIVNCIVKNTRADCGWIELFDPQTGKFSLFATRGIPAQLTDNDKLQDILSLLEYMKPPAKALIIDNVLKDTHTLKMSQFALPWRSLIALPILSANDLVGIIYLAKEETYGFGPEDEQALEPLLIQAGINLERS